MFGLPVGDPNNTKKSKRSAWKPERIEPNFIVGIRESTNAEKNAMVDATNYLEIFNKNIDYSGKADVQQMVEFMAQIMDVPDDERAGRAKQMAELFVANQMKSKMEPVLRQHGNGTAKSRDTVSDWAKHYSRASRWEAFFLFVWEGLQGNKTLSTAQKSGSDFVGLKTYELLRLSFLSMLPEVGPFVSMVGCKHFEHTVFIEVEPPAVAKPKKRPRAPAKVAPAQKTAKTVGNTRLNWMAQGVPVNTWKPGTWQSMSESEKYDYRNGRSQSGLWSDQIPEHLRCNPGKKISVC